MTIHKLSDPTDLIYTSTGHNDLGEKTLPFAPEVELQNGEFAAPQQYLHVQRSLQSVEHILSRVQYADDYILFSGCIGSMVYLQVGVIGHENYPRAGRPAQKAKIVYGRRWGLEQSTPTSEVVQTALLALKKAREHELREKLFYQDGDRKTTTTPFNSHQDLPLMVANAQDFLVTSNHEMDVAIERIRFNCLRFNIYKTTRLSEQSTVIEIDVVDPHGSESIFTELIGQRMALVVESADANTLLHVLMSELIKRSDRHVEENFEFDGFSRFSHRLDVASIAEFSYQSRNIKSKDSRFDDFFEDMNYQVDSLKAPNYAGGELGQKQRSAIHTGAVEMGYLPLEQASQGGLLLEPKLRKVQS
ncbi:MAG: hypothetical protein ACI9FR_000935 [Cryomorphaceae bacterium]|jgi:hypothetical protein